MRPFPAFLLFFLLIFSSGLAEAGHEIVLSPNNGHSNQDQINEALANADVVYLTAGMYPIDGPIDNIDSDTILTGDTDAIIQVYGGSSQWFTGMKGPVCSQGPVDNVLIENIWIDGNLDELPRSYANSGGGDHNCERGIIIKGSSNRFSTNITIRNVKVIDCYSDGIHVRFCNGVNVFNNFISNCQHSGIFYVSVVNGIIDSNKVAGIVSDCVRLDSCEQNIVCNNILYSYTGDNSNGQYEGGQNSLQIADQGYSHGGGSDKPTHTTDIEVYGNVFANTGLRAIWLDSTGKGVENVFIHHNTFVDVAPVEVNGQPVSFENIPTKEMSEQIFNDIFDVLNLEFIDNALGLTQGIIIPVPEWEEKKKAAAYIYLAGYDGQITIDNHTFIPENPWECARVSTGTKNLASKPAGQTSELKLSEGPNKGLHAELKVKTKFKTKAKKSVSLMGKTVSYNGTVTESKTEIFERDFPAPEVFPVISEKDLNISVKYFNNTYNPHTTITIEPKKGNVDVFRAITYKYNGSIATDERYLGHVSRQKSGFKTVNYKETTEWLSLDGFITYRYQGCFIPGHLDTSLLSVDIATPYENFTITNFDVEEIKDPTIGVLRKLLILFTILGFLGMFAVSGFKMLIISFGGTR